MNDQEEHQVDPKPATFEGRLKLNDFAYQGADFMPRRSARISKASPSASVSSASVTPASPAPQSPSKAKPGRSQRANNNEDGHDEDFEIEAEASQGRSNAKKRKRTASGYAPPSTYAHLPLLPDAIKENLLVLFVGLNPGIQTARSGHAYAHPSNLFWKLLYSSGVTPRPCRAEEDREMPRLYSLGLTNIVSRPSRNGGELRKTELDDGVATLEEKARKWRPESVCIVGKSIWESIWRVRHGGKAVGAAFKYGWQDESENMGQLDGEWAGARVFVATSTSGLAASLSKAEKERIWSELGSWVKTRRAEREAEQENEAV
jgi:thymine-DNA glycosylase